MSRKIIVISILLFCFVSFSHGQDKQLLPEGDRLLGIWLTESKDKIEIYKDSQEYFGKPFVEPGYKDRLDVNNPDKSLRNRSLVDTKILKNLKYIGKNRWAKGAVYDPASGKTYQCIITMKSENKIKMRGYIGVSWIGRTFTWTRVITE